MPIKPIVFSQEDEEGSNVYRNRFVRLVADQENAIQALSGETAVELADQTVKKDADEARVASAAKIILAGFTYELVKTMEAKNKQAIELAVDNGAETIAKKFSNPDYNRLVDKTAKQVIADQTKYLQVRKWPGTEITMGTRIKTIEGSSLKTVQDILRTGANEGTAAKKIAEEINNFIRPTEGRSWTSPFTWYRDGFGYKQSKSVPANRLAGSVNSNAMRIARTEINQTWRLGTIEFHKDEPWIEGYSWNLSPSHPEEDICDEWAEGGPYSADEIAELGHPYCMCNVRPIFREYNGEDYLDTADWEEGDEYPEFI